MFINFTVATKAECNIVHMFSYHLVGGSTPLESSKLGRDLMIYAICMLVHIPTMIIYAHGGGPAAFTCTFDLMNPRS